MGAEQWTESLKDIYGVQVGNAMIIVAAHEVSAVPSRCQRFIDGGQRLVYHDRDSSGCTRASFLAR